MFSAVWEQGSQRTRNTGQTIINHGRRGNEASLYVPLFRWGGILLSTKYAFEALGGNGAVTSQRQMKPFNSCKHQQWKNCWLTQTSIFPHSSINFYSTISSPLQRGKSIQATNGSTPHWTVNCRGEGTFPQWPGLYGILSGSSGTKIPAAHTACTSSQLLLFHLKGESFGLHPKSVLGDYQFSS